MADEVIIEEYENIGAIGGADKPLPRTLVTTQVLDITVTSAQFNERTKWIRIQSNDTPLWYKIGLSSVSAAANTDGNCFLPANQFRDLAINPATDKYISTAADV